MRGPAVALALLGLAACAGRFPDPTGAREPMPQGYLAPAELTRLAQAVPPFPAPGSPEDIADRAASDAYRAMEDDDRWLMATAHAEVRPDYAVQHFDCPLGARLVQAELPTLKRILERALHDADTASAAAKARAFRARPIKDDPDRRACVRLDPGGRDSASYPSGTATVGAVYGLVIASAAPDAAAGARRIGHEIGVSRAVCAMHYPADVAAGEALGESLFMAMAADPRFQADIVEARREVAAARASGLTNPGCAAERHALGAGR